jgi:GNAT superfamily N-acetyltransferase
MTLTIDAAVRTSTSHDRDAISSVLTRAFTDDPVFIWMIPDPARRTAVLPGLFSLFVQAYQPLQATQVIAGPGTADPIAGAALWAPPGTHAVDDEDAEEFAARIEQVTGTDTGRVLEVIGLLEEQHPSADCSYLNLLGVDPARHGSGLGSALLATTLRRCDAGAGPAYLEATSPRNRRLYARHGFEVVGEIALPEGPSLWPMWRDPRP